MKIDLIENKQNKNASLIINDYVQDELTLNDHGYYVAFNVPKGVLYGIDFFDLPDNLELWIKVIIPPELRKKGQSFHVIVKKIDKSGIYVNYIDLIDFLDLSHADSSYIQFLQSKKLIIQDRSKLINDIKYVNYFEDEFDSAGIEYHANVKFKNFDHLINYSGHLYSEINKLASLAAEFPMIDLKIGINLQVLKEQIIIPILLKLGFFNVVYNTEENKNGKDIIFTKISDFDEYEFYCAKVYNKDLSNLTENKIEKIVTEIHDAFYITFNDILSNEQKFISKMALITPFYLPDNVKKSITSKISGIGIKNNIIFIDKYKIEYFMFKLF